MQGLDRAAPPTADKAKAMLDEIGGSWWNVYIGGPRASVKWTPAQVQSYQAAGIDHFLLTYVGRQQDDVRLLTTAQGGRDGEDAAALVADFGFGQGTPVCLDLEIITFNAAPRASLDYAGGWCSAVRRLGLRPGVYTNVGPLKALAQRAEQPDWVFVAHWVRRTPDSTADADDIPGLPDDLWPGRRAWQYAGALDGRPCTVGGLSVDIDVTDASSGCLTGTPAPGVAGKVKLPSLLEEEDDMFTFSTNGKPVFFVAGGKAVGLNGQDDLQVIRGAVQNLPHFQLDADTFDQFLRAYRD
jgi:hypothetical protein